MRLGYFTTYLRHNKRRAALSMLGVAIGVFALVLTSGIAQAMAQQVRDELGKLGSDLILVSSAEIKSVGMRRLSGRSYTTLTREDAEAVLQTIPGVLAVAPLHYSLKAPVKGSLGSTTVSLSGITPIYEQLSDNHPACGRYIQEDDDKRLAQVALLGSEIAKQLFGHDCPVGQIVYLYGYTPYRVVGVLEPRGSVGSESYDERVYVPLSTLQRRLANITHIDGFLVLPDVTRGKMVLHEVESLLLHRHQKRDFSVVRYEEVAATSAEALDIVGRLSLIVSGIAFGVGALGILAILTLSVYERLVEIGLRRAVGATKRAIFLQFVGEALMLSVGGLVIGLMVSLTILVVVEVMASWPLVIPWGAVASSLLLSVGVGVVAGLYPAWRAIEVEARQILQSE
ncbi:MAG: ABC transporter permease [Campylobacterales bacterium]